MVLVHLTPQIADEGRDSAPSDINQDRQIDGQLFAEIEHLRRERDYLRSALIDAGFSLRAETIAHCADRSR